MISKILYVAVLGSAMVAAAATQQPSFAGRWTFDPGQSREVGMMSAMKIHTLVTQNANELIVDDISDFNGQTDTQHIVYDLEGKSVPNHPIMGGTAMTRSHWESSRLVTEWESPGSIAGTAVKRTEVRYLSADGSTMFIESSRSNQKPMVMVFTRDR